MKGRSIKLINVIIQYTCPARKCSEINIKWLYNHIINQRISTKPETKAIKLKVLEQ